MEWTACLLQFEMPEKQWEVGENCRQIQTTSWTTNSLGSVVETQLRMLTMSKTFCLSNVLFNPIAEVDFLTN